MASLYITALSCDWNAPLEQPGKDLDPMIICRKNIPSGLFYKEILWADFLAGNTLYRKQPQLSNKKWHSRNVIPLRVHSSLSCRISLGFFPLIHSGLNKIHAILFMQVTCTRYSGISGFWQVYKCNVLSRFCRDNRLAYKLADFWAVSWLLTRLLSLHFRSQLSYTEALLALWISSWATKKKLFEEQLFLLPAYKCKWHSYFKNIKL